MRFVENHQPESVADLGHPRVCAVVRPSPWTGCGLNRESPTMPASTPRLRRIRRCHWCIRSRTGATTSVATPVAAMIDSATSVLPVPVGITISPRPWFACQLSTAVRCSDRNSTSCGFGPMHARWNAGRDRESAGPKLCQQRSPSVGVLDRVGSLRADPRIELPTGPRRGTSQDQRAAVEREFRRITHGSLSRFGQSRKRQRRGVEDRR